MHSSVIACHCEKFIKRGTKFEFVFVISEMPSGLLYYEEILMQEADVLLRGVVRGANVIPVS